MGHHQKAQYIHYGCFQMRERKKRQEGLFKKNSEKLPKFEGGHVYRNPNLCAFALSYFQTTILLLPPTYLELQV
jgi:hypothetical protein